jgi:AcrR family transcriptional regulator
MELIKERGRPRDPRLDGAILQATRDLLVEHGYSGLTIGAVADRADTTKPTLYRRWSSKAHLVHDAVFPDSGGDSVPHSGTFEEDLRALVVATLEVFTSPSVRAAVPGLLADLTPGSDLLLLLRQRLQSVALTSLQRRLDAGVATGEVQHAPDPGVLLDAIAGTVFMAVAFRSPDELGSTWVDATTQLLLKGLA